MISTLIQLSKQNSYSHNRNAKSRPFPPEIITFVFISWPCYTTPNSLIPVTELLALVIQLRYLPLTVFSFKSLLGYPCYLSATVLECTLVVEIYSYWRWSAIALPNKQIYQKCSATQGLIITLFRFPLRDVRT